MITPCCIKSKDKRSAFNQIQRQKCTTLTLKHYEMLSKWQMIFLTREKKSTKKFDQVNYKSKRYNKWLFQPDKMKMYNKHLTQKRMLKKEFYTHSINY